MLHFLPCLQAGFYYPGIEFIQIGPAALADLTPDTSPAVLHVLLDDAFLPARRTIAELGFKQVVACH